MILMSNNENSIAVLIRRFTNPVQLLLGSAIALSGIAVLLSQVVPTP